MLAQPIGCTHPFEFFRFDEAFGAEQCAAFETLFSEDCEWQRREGGFYRCSLRDVTRELSPVLLSALRSRMVQITGLPLAERVQVTAQRLSGGQSIGVHSDHSLVGYELLRLVLQLNADWRTEDGGLLELYESPNLPAVVTIEPRYDVAFGFVLHEGSMHGVTEACKPRRSMVFNFWHLANSPELGDTVRDLFGAANFAELPGAVDASAAWAEARLSEEATFSASLIAWALHLWGYDEATVVAGYRRGVGLSCESLLSDEQGAAVRLAEWVAGLYEQPFDLRRWESLKRELRGVKPGERLMPLWRLCLLEEGQRLGNPEPLR